jgi:hypothetical protein
MLRGRARGRVKQKAKSRAKQQAKQRVRGAASGGGDHKLLKAAAVGGTAYYAGKKISENRQDGQTSAQDAPSTPSTAPAPAAADDTISQLERLSTLKSQGILTDEEFQAQKAKILGT